MSRVDEPVFNDMLTTQDTTRMMGASAEQCNKNHKNAKEKNAYKTGHDKRHTSTQMDTCAPKSKKRKK